VWWLILPTTRSELPTTCNADLSAAKSAMIRCMTGQQKPIAACISVTILVLLLVPLGVLSPMLWQWQQFPVDCGSFRRLKTGATQEEVERLLGTPRDTHTLYGELRWCYYRPNGTRILYLIFDTNTIYKGYELDD